MTMPNFLIIGAPKAGTTSLYAYLKQHPQIYMPPVKEPHFFALDNRGVSFQGPGDQTRLASAVHQLETYKNLFTGVKDEIAIGEASTNYLGSRCAPERIKQLIPEVKLIAVLRNPIDAAYASYLHLMRNGDEFIKDFSVALQAEPERIQKNWGWQWRYQQRGFYFEALERYFSIFEHRQIKVYLFEDFKDDTDGVLRDIFNFLGVESSFKSKTASRHNASAMPKSLLMNRLLIKPNILRDAAKILFPQAMRQNLYHRVRAWNLNNFQKPEMSADSRAYLKQVFRGDILKLEGLIERDLSAWLE